MRPSDSIDLMFRWIDPYLVMKIKAPPFGFLLLSYCLAVVPAAQASTQWYANGSNGNDVNSCKSAATACKTIGHAVLLARSGDAINIAPATYIENLTIAANLRLLGSAAATTTIDGGSTGTAVRINSGSKATLSKLTLLGHLGGGRSVYNSGVLTINNAILTGDYGADADGGGSALLTALGSTTTINNSTFQDSIGRLGGAIYNRGNLTINRSSITHNGDYNGSVGGIYIERGNVVISNSDVSGNYSNNQAGGIYVGTGKLSVINSTLNGNYTVNGGGAINNLVGVVDINNSTISGNESHSGGTAGGLFTEFNGITIQNSILANTIGGNCAPGTTAVVSYGYNMSSGPTCDFHNTGDLTNIDPKLGPLKNNGGPTETMALLKGSPAIDSGNPGGCTDGLGVLLKTDQRGAPRPDKGTNRCDRGAFEVRKQ